MRIWFEDRYRKESATGGKILGEKDLARAEWARKEREEARVLSAGAGAKRGRRLHLARKTPTTAYIAIKAKKKTSGKKPYRGR